MGYEGRVLAAAFSPDGTRVVTAGWDKYRTAQIWEAATGEPMRHEAYLDDTPRWPIFGVAAFSPDDTRVVAASDENTARVWDAATESCRAAGRSDLRAASLPPGLE